jgi:endoribonuclease LACTB2
MLEVVRHDGVTEWRTSSTISRAFRYTASAFLTEDGVLVDTGIPAARRDLLRALAGARPDGVIVTHHHEDHAGNVEALARAGLPIWVSDATRNRVERVAPIRAYRRFTWQPMPALRSHTPSFIAEGYEVVATPGHCADHHAVWHVATRTLFAGDLYLGPEVRVAHHDEDPFALLASLEQMIALAPDRMYCAHRGLVRDATQRLTAKAAWHRQTLQELERRVQEGQSDAQILQDALGGESTIGRASFGEYSRRNLVRAVRRSIAEGR